MPITSVTKDPQALTMTLVAEFPVGVQRLWDAYADPRQLERFWGPPTYPAVFTRHDMYVGGRSVYAMTGPEGDVSRGCWDYLAVNPTKSFEVLDAFADEAGQPNPEMPNMRMVFDFEETARGSRMTNITYFNSLEQLEQLLAMGMEEGATSAMAQMDAVLADLASFAADRVCEAQILSDSRIRVSRVIRGTVEQVWAAHHEPALMQQWLLGPDGWTMPVCEVARQVGDQYRYEWEQEDGSGRFGFTGELLESAPPHRAVTTEQMIGMAGDPVVNEMTLTPLGEGTLLSILITYPSAEIRGMVLGSGMTGGMETSFARLEGTLLAAV